MGYVLSLTLSQYSHLPIGGFVWAILDAITNTRGHINDLRRQINSLQEAQRTLYWAQRTSSDIRQTVTTLSQGWSSLTTKTQVLKELVKAYERNPALEDSLRPIVRANWKGFENEMSEW